MNKLKNLMKKLVRAGVIGAMLIAVSLAAYLGATMFSSDSEKEKKAAQDQYQSDKSLQEDLKHQLSNSDEAGKRFMVIQQNRRTANYDGSSDSLIKYLQQAKLRYKFDQFNLSRPQKANPTDKDQLKNLSNFDIGTRPLQFKISAVSDLHVFSFIDDLIADIPGIVRIDNINLKRTQDMNDSLVNMLSSGSKITAVEATVDLTWITVSPKESTKDSDKATPAGGASATPSPVKEP